jgi:mono/diheme cytochrome c family protein
MREARSRMSMRERIILAGAVLLAGAVVLARASGAGSHHIGDPPTVRPGLGRPASQDVIRRMDITIAADGAGLPAGSGSVAEGRTTYDLKCAGCHGPAGSGAIADRLTGGIGTLTSTKPIKTVASYWPYAPTLFDYIRRDMPLTAPQSLDDAEVYGLVAYLLSIDGIVARNARLDGPSLSRIKMPNRDGFVSLETKGFEGNIELVKPRSSN